jgi:hypothetical protein
MYETGLSKTTTPPPYSVSGSGHSAVYVNQETDTDRQPRMKNLLQLFNSEISKQAKLVSEIDNKLHLLYNKITPEKEADVEKGKENDALTALSSELSRLETNNNKLDRILSHLMEII